MNIKELTRIYNRIYAVYVTCFGVDDEYELANDGDYGRFSKEMLEKILKYLEV